MYFLRRNQTSFLSQLHAKIALSFGMIKNYPSSPQDAEFSPDNSQEVRHEIVLRGGTFQYAVQAPPENDSRCTLQHGIFHGQNGRTKTIEELTGQSRLILLDLAARTSFLYDEENPNNSTIQLDKAISSQDIRKLLHEIGHLNQYEDTAIREVALVKRRFAEAKKRREPLPVLLATLEPINSHIPSLRLHFESLKEQIFALDPKLWIHPTKSLGIMKEESALEALRQKQTEQKTEKQARASSIGEILLGALPQIESASSPKATLHLYGAREFCESWATGTFIDLFDPIYRCALQIQRTPFEIRFLFFDEETTNSSLLAHLSTVEQSAVLEHYSAYEECIRLLSEIKEAIDQKDQWITSLKSTQLKHPSVHTQLLYGGKYKNPFGQNKLTLASLATEATRLIERDATYRTFRWLRQLRDELGIDLLADEEADGFLHKRSLGTYEAEITQTTRRLGFVPSFPRGTFQKKV